MAHKIILSISILPIPGWYVFISIGLLLALSVDLFEGRLEFFEKSSLIFVLMSLMGSFSAILGTWGLLRGLVDKLDRKTMVLLTAGILVYGPTVIFVGFSETNGKTLWELLVPYYFLYAPFIVALMWIYIIVKKERGNNQLAQ